jgi:pyrimidine 5'-nucleotidase
VDFDWIFFDCFNTLIDDFDNDGDESGLCSLPADAVEMGLFESARDFLAAYFAIRKGSIQDGREILLAERLTGTLSKSTALADRDVASLVASLMARWSKEYPAILRPTSGVHEMLAPWRDRKRLGVVSISTCLLSHLAISNRLVYKIILTSFSIARRSDLRNQTLAFSADL